MDQYKQRSLLSKNPPGSHRRCLFLFCRRMLLIILMLVALLTVSTALADEKEQHEVRQLRMSGTILSLEYFIEQSKRLHSGRVIDASLQYEDPHKAYVYEIVVLDNDGKVWVLEYYAHTGKLIESGNRVDAKKGSKDWGYFSNKVGSEEKPK